MPDHAFVNELYGTPSITVNELARRRGERAQKNLRMYDNNQMIEMLARIQRLEIQCEHLNPHHAHSDG